MAENKLIEALMWPVNDVPKIFEIGSTGASAALPGLVEVGVVAAILFFKPLKVGNQTAVDVETLALAYAAAAGVSFVLNRM